MTRPLHVAGETDEPVTRGRSSLLGHLVAAMDLTSVVELAGMAAITVGVSMWELPVGVIVGGILAVGSAVMLELSKRGEDAESRQA